MQSKHYAASSLAVAGSAMKTSRSLTNSRSQPYSFSSKGLPLATPSSLPERKGQHSLDCRLEKVRRCISVSWNLHRSTLLLEQGGLMIPGRISLRQKNVRRIAPCWVVCSQALRRRNCRSKSTEPPTSTQVLGSGIRKAGTYPFFDRPVPYSKLIEDIGFA